MLFTLITGAAIAAAMPTNVGSSSSRVTVNKNVPQSAGAAILAPFVSFSIEFSSFPDFAGNKSKPNGFSNQLLDNLADLQGVKPHIRVGGNTQDFALYDPNLKTQINGTVVPSVSEDYPYIISIGPSYFEAYSTWPGVKFSHGFNLGKNTSAAYDTLIATVPLACKALRKDNFAYWELGNEPDLFTGAVRPSGWNEEDYVAEWLNKTPIIKAQIAKACPEMTSNAAYKYIAPSFAGLTNDLDPIETWDKGLNQNQDIGMNSMHNYMGGADSPGVTLAHTLMNHTAVVHSVSQHANLARTLSQKGLTKDRDIPYILGEMNSLYHQGKPGLSNSFGAALWGVDFNLYCASQSIHRTHMHQGTDYRYASWQPVQTDKTTIGTKAPYYGNAMVAAMLRGSGDEGSEGRVQLVNLEMPHETEAAYAAYVNGQLARIAIINMQQHNYTGNNDSSASRPSASYQFLLPETEGKSLSVQRLLANGSDAITGITWDGWSYNYELKGGAPVRLHNVTTGETIAVGAKGAVELAVPWSSAVILNL
ncbi:Glycoside hydrolase superfamily [Penicillium macrosclerotiorum]|uniref:Glycoside hydrolase superfamily n=1 Tax=Penicillium macrosclerotiorum TaxID=303699 RepID=UPI0025497E17|nr:Glycoside hydrolase superfamily [Penicillium macrosclerotiorum]KAJ5692588.1 Glycoside hydrolase superfamily [Penicillium macrosclerotiorum]